MVGIDITALKEGVHEVRVTAVAEDLELDESFSGIVTDAQLDIGEHQIVVDLSVRGVARLMCDRTLEMFDQALEGSYTVVFVKDANVADPGEEVRQLDPTETTLDVTDIVRDTLLLAVPLRRVAPDAADAELVLTYGAPGAGAQIDPRWQALEKLKGTF